MFFLPQFQLSKFQSVLYSRELYNLPWQIQVNLNAFYGAEDTQTVDLDPGTFKLVE
jgi:hypothetical protein